jgi:hypothetical protein
MCVVILEDKGETTPIHHRDGQEMKGESALESKIEILSTVRISYTDELYKIVDALNRTLKKDDYMFGLALDPEDQSQAVLTIYRT